MWLFHKTHKSMYFTANILRDYLFPSEFLWSTLLINCSSNNFIISCLPFCWLFFWLSNFTASRSLSSVSWYFSTIDCSFSSLMLYLAIFSRPVFWISSLKWCTSSLWRRVMAVPNEINTKSQTCTQSLFTGQIGLFQRESGLDRVQRARIYGKRQGKK